MQFIFQCPYPVQPSNRIFHIFCHYTTKQETDMRQYMHKYMVHRMEYCECIGHRFFEAMNITADDYANRLLLDNTPLDLFGIFLLARLYWIHVGVFMHGGVWSTSRINDIRLSKFILIYRGLTEFLETCTLNGADLYLDSLILNTQHGCMLCHRDIAKLEGIDNVADSPVDLTVTSDADVPPRQQEINTDVKPVVKRENKKDTDLISSMSVLYTQPKNKLKTSLYKKSLQLLLKAKAEIKMKSECKEKTDRITDHIQNVTIDPAKVAQCTRSKRTSMISSNCELCGEPCRSQRAYVRHRTEFHPTQPYHCGYCNKQYLSATGCYTNMRDTTYPQVALA